MNGREQGFSKLVGCPEMLRNRASRAVLGACLTSLVALTGCSNFFQCENKPACPSTTTTGTGTGTTTTGSGDYAYVAFTTTSGSSVVTGFDVSSGALTATGTLTLPFVPIAMAVNAADTLLYVASVPGASSPGVYAYTIGSGGTLTAANGGAALVTDLVGTMALSPDGNYLYTAESTGATMTQYTINTSTGGLTSSGVLTIPSLSCGLSATVPVLRTCGLAVSPEKNYVVASLGTEGEAVFNYSSSSGITGNGAFSQIAASTASGNFSAALDASNRLYVAQTSSMTAYSLSSTTITNLGTFTYPSGTIPRSVVVDKDSQYVYTAGVGLSTITGFAIGSSTALTLISGAPFTAPTNVASLGIDNTNAYLVAAGYNATSGIELYSIGSGGALTAVTSAATSTQTGYPVLVAMSH